MVAEAIVTLGRSDDVPGWVEAYKAKHNHVLPPPRKEPIDGRNETQWRAALGDYARATDWLDFFRKEIEERPWQDTITNWIPVLISGYFGGLTHGLIRTAHAVRAFPEDGAATRLEIDELARGLAYWAGTYRQFPGNPVLHGNLPLDEAIHRLPRLDPKGQKGLPPEALNEPPGFADAIDSLAAVADPKDAIHRHTAAFARVLIAHPEIPPIPLVHTITALTAMQNLLPFFAPEFGVRAYARLWQVSAAIVALFAPAIESGSETDFEIGGPAFGVDELVDRAIEHGDEHTIKLTEACLREDRIGADPAYRAAAEALLHRTAPLA